MTQYNDVSNQIHVERMKRIKNEIEDLIRSMEQDHNCSFVNDNETNYEKSLETCRGTTSETDSGSTDSSCYETRLKIDSEFSTNRFKNEAINSNMLSKRHKSRVSRVCLKDEESVIDSNKMMESFRKDMEQFKTTPND